MCPHLEREVLRVLSKYIANNRHWNAPSTCKQQCLWRVTWGQRSAPASPHAASVTEPVRRGQNTCTETVVATVKLCFLDWVSAFFHAAGLKETPDEIFLCLLIQMSPNTAHCISWSLSYRDTSETCLSGSVPGRLRSFKQLLRFDFYRHDELHNWLHFHLCVVPGILGPKFLTNLAKNIICDFYESSVWVNIFNCILQRGLHLKSNRFFPIISHPCLHSHYTSHSSSFTSHLSNCLLTTDFLINPWLATYFFPIPGLILEIMSIFLIVSVNFVATSNILRNGFGVLWSFSNIFWLSTRRTQMLLTMGFFILLLKHFLQSSGSDTI